MKGSQAALLVLDHLLALFALDVAAVQRVRPRDGSSANDTIPAPLSATPSQYWDGNDGPWSSFALTVGPPGTAQSVRVFPSSKSSAFWVIMPGGCPEGYYPNGVDECEDSRGGVYNSNDSATWLPQGLYTLHIDDSLGYSTGVGNYSDGTGDYGYDIVTPGFSGSNSAVSHQVIAEIEWAGWWLGVMPLNPRPFNFTNLDQPQISFLSQLRATDAIPSKSWSYTAGAKYRYSGVFGSLTLGGYDEGRFSANGTNITVAMGMEQETDLTVGLQKITTASGETSLLSDGIYAVIDSTVPEIYLPQDACDAFAENFGLEWNSTLETYLLNDTQYTTLSNSNDNITFQLGASSDASSSNETITVDVPITAFLKTLSFPRLGQTAGNDTSYYFPLKPTTNTDGESTTYTLGRTFLQEAYVIADYERSTFTVAPCTWTSSTPEESIVPIYALGEEPSSTSHSSSSTLSAGAIAGIVIGCVVVLLLVLLLLLLRRRRRRLAAQKAEAFPALAPTDPRRPSIGARLRGWSWTGRSRTLSDAKGFELAQNQHDPTPGEVVLAAHEAERKRHLSGELEGAGVHEMFAGRKDPVELEGEGPLGPDGLGGLGGFYGPRKEVHEMDASVVSSQTGTPLPSPPLPSPGMLEASSRRMGERDAFDRNAAAFLAQHARSQSDSSIETVASAGVSTASMGVSPIRSTMHSRSQSEAGTGTMLTLNDIREERGESGSASGSRSPVSRVGVGGAGTGMGEGEGAGVGADVHGGGQVQGHEQRHGARDEDGGPKVG